MVDTTPTTCPGRPAGPVSTCSVPCSPATRPAPWPWTSARVGPPGPRRRRSRDAGPAAALATSTLVPASHGQRRTIPFPSGPMQAGDHAARGPRGHVDPLRPAGAPTPPRATPEASPRTARRQRRGHRRRVRPDTWMPRTPGHRTPGHRTRGCWRSARPVGRTSHGRTGRGGQGNDRPGRRPDILATGDTRWAARSRPGHGDWGRSVTHDGSAVTAPAPRP